MNVETKQIRAAAGREPVALAGVLRTGLYALLGTRLDARTLAEVVFIAETLTAMIVRHFVSPRPAPEQLLPAPTPARPPIPVNFAMSATRDGARGSAWTG